ncbi:MAG TPA: hypothetical protein VL463_29650 [Kofleriaceae bacterium]|nr:hypothetical protein [Kofleriaceae bacterium]
MRRAWLAIVLAGCATTSPPARCPAYELHPQYVDFIPFGAGQLQNGQRGKGLAFAIAEGATAATSAGIWLYLDRHYEDGRVPADEALRSQRLQRIEIGTGVAFLALFALGVADALAHHEDWVSVPCGPE